MKDLKNYIDQNRNRFLEELFSLICIPSISSQEEHKEDMIKCAHRWKELIQEAGADRCEVMPTEGNPVVFGEKNIAPDAPTVLVYGHYDVMPVDPVELWKSNPFEPEIRDGKIWARGADDDKGQSLCTPRLLNLWLKPGSSHVMSNYD
jgi:acetylornithine deacetylase/succinyl-diaminopimelate desuccinylase-like protein